MKRKKLWIWAAVTVLAAAAIALTVDWPAVLAAVTQVTLWDVLRSAGCILLSKVAYAAKWRALYPGAAFFTVFRTVLGSMPLFLLPAGGFVSDGYRIAALRHEGYAAVTSILLDRLTMPLSILCICLPLFALSVPDFLPAYGYGLLGLVAVAALLAVVLLLSKRPRTWLLHHTARFARLQGGLQRAFEAIDAMCISPWRIVATILLGFVGDVLTSGAYAVFGMGLGIGLPPTHWLFVYALPLIANTALPTAAGVGVRDAALIAFLSQYGISSAAAVSLSTLYVGALALAAAVGWLAHWCLRHRAT